MRTLPGSRASHQSAASLGPPCSLALGCWASWAALCPGVCRRAGSRLSEGSLVSSHPPGSLSGVVRLGVKPFASSVFLRSPFPVYHQMSRTTDASAEWHRLEKARRARLKDIGVSQTAIEGSELTRTTERPTGCIRVMQWNLLADGMSSDGFLVNDVLEDWPAGHGNVPTANGESVPSSKLLNEMMTARGDIDALTKLKERYCVPAAQQNLECVIDLQARQLQIQLQVLAAGRPDVLVFQECDFYGVLLPALEQIGYTSKLPHAEKRYTPAHLVCNDNRTPHHASNFQEMLKQKGFGFLPNLSSTAMNLRLNKETFREKVIAAARKLGIEKVSDAGKLEKDTFLGLDLGSTKLLEEAGIDPLSMDDDGVAIFWREDVFTACALHAQVFPKGAGGALQIHLQELCPGGRCLVVLGAHLASGDDNSSEQKRLKSQVEVGGGVRELVEASRKQGDAVVLCLDANSHPQIGVETGTSVWRSLRPALGASVWDDYFDATGSSQTSTSLDAPVTSNKLRGPVSEQTKKVGLHSYYCIDHIFFNPAQLALREHIYHPKRFESAALAREDLSPSLSTPSDHYPVIVDFRWLSEVSPREAGVPARLDDDIIQQQVGQVSEQGTGSPGSSEEWQRELKTRL